MIGASTCGQVDANEQLLAGRLNRTALTLLSSRDPLTPAVPLSPQQQQQLQQRRQRNRSSSGSDNSRGEQQYIDTDPASEEDPWLLSTSTTASGTTAAATAATVRAAHAAAHTAIRSPPRMAASASARALAAATTRTAAVVAVAAVAQQQQQQHTHKARCEAKQRPASAPHRRVKHPAGGASPPHTMNRVASHTTVGVTVGSAAADQLNEYIAEMERLTCDAKAALSALRCEGGGGGGSAAVTIQRYWRYTADSTYVSLLICLLHIY
jgi:hypothetical protein